MRTPMPSRNIDDFIHVARLLDHSPPPWLPEQLRNWTASLFLDRWVEIKQPTRAEMRSILRHVQSAAALLNRALGSDPVREFLEAATVPFANLGHLTQSLEDLIVRAYLANNSAALATKAGRTKPGRGRAATIGAFSPETYCALIISETWKFLHGAEPLAKNQKAAAAAERLWRAAGGDARGAGEEPLARWRYHFKTVHSLPADNLRAEYRRHLVESDRLWKLPIGLGEEAA